MAEDDAGTSGGSEVGGKRLCLSSIVEEDAQDTRPEASLKSTLAFFPHTCPVSDRDQSFSELIPV